MLVVCPLLTVSKRINLEVQRLLVLAQEELLKALTSNPAPSIVLSPRLLQLRPPVRFVLDSISHWGRTTLGMFPAETQKLMSEIVFSRASFDRARRMNRAMWEGFYPRLPTWQDKMGGFAGLKTVSVEMPREGFTTTHIAALKVGRMLLERNTIATFQLLFRHRVTVLAGQRCVESVFGPLHDAKTTKVLPGCEFKTVAREYDLVEARPWAFEHGEPWFSDGKAMQQVLRITRWRDTRVGTEAYEKCTTRDCVVHTNFKLEERRSARLQSS